MVSEIFHWVEERSCEEWAKGHLEKCLRELLEPYLTIDRFEFDGVANVSRRYGRVICLFNFDAQLFDCHWVDDNHGDSSITFDMNINNLSSFKYDIEADFLQYYKPLKIELRETINQKCKKALENFIEYFETEYVKDILSKLEKFTEKNLQDSGEHMYDDLKQKNLEKKASNPDATNEKSLDSNDPNKQLDSQNQAKDSTRKLAFEISHSFTYNLQALYEFFTDANSLSNLTQSVCEFLLEAGKPFNLMDSQIIGECVSFEPNKRLELSMRFSDWSETENAFVSITFTEKSHNLVDILLRVHDIDDDSKKQSMQSFLQEVFLDNIKRIVGENY